MCEREMCVTADKTYIKINPLSTLVPKKQSTMSAAVFLIRNIKSVSSPGYETDERSLLG